MTFADRMAAWAENEPSVRALVLIGSQTRAASDQVWKADAQSDWDFQIITSRVDLFEDASWTAALGLKLHTYAVRRAAIGGVPKIAALFAGAEADFVILPLAKLNPWRIAVARSEHHRSPVLQRQLQDLAVVVRPGWRFIKGAKTWEPLYQRAVAEIADPRLDDAAVCGLADGFVCDAVWTARKVERGEWLAAQRMLHRSLAETNFRLLHELKLRRGERTFPEIRRGERVLSRREQQLVTVSAIPDARSLRAALKRSSATCRKLMQALVGDAWSWPEL